MACARLLRERNTLSQLKKTPYRVVACNVHTGGVAEADRIAAILKEVAWPRATPSLVIREASERLREDLHDKAPDEIFRDFIDRRGRRAGRSTHKTAMPHP